MSKLIEAHAKVLRVLERNEAAYIRRAFTGGSLIEPSKTLIRVHGLQFANLISLGYIANIGQDKSIITQHGRDALKCETK